MASADAAISSARRFSHLSNLIGSRAIFSYPSSLFSSPLFVQADADGFSTYTLHRDIPLRHLQRSLAITVLHQNVSDDSLERLGDRHTTVFYWLQLELAGLADRGVLSEHRLTTLSTSIAR